MHQSFLCCPCRRWSAMLFCKQSPSNCAQTQWSSARQRAYPSRKDKRLTGLLSNRRHPPSPRHYHWAQGQSSPIPVRSIKCKVSTKQASLLHDYSGSLSITNIMFCWDNKNNVAPKMRSLGATCTAHLKSPRGDGLTHNCPNSPECSSALVSQVLPLHCKAPCRQTAYA